MKQILICEGVAEGKLVFDFSTEEEQKAVCKHLFFKLEREKEFQYPNKRSLVEMEEDIKFLEDFKYSMLGKDISKSKTMLIIGSRAGKLSELKAERNKISNFITNYEKAQGGDLEAMEKLVLDTAEVHVYNVEEIW